MSRLIDADALWRDITTAYDDCEDILEIIDRQPTIEPQPIIHCKDCIHIRHWNRQECSINDRVVEDTDFCSWAERGQDG